MRFFYCTEGMRCIWNKYGVYFSEKFCSFFSDNVKDILYREAGLRPSFKVSLSVFRPRHDLPMYEPGAISRINTAISILPYYTDAISFCWRSKSGAIVYTFDEVFDETSLECWIEGLKPAEYLKQLTTVSTDHPLKLKNLPYQLDVYGIGMHMGLAIELSDAANAAGIIRALGDEVEKHNRKSEAKGRANGVVHNCHGEAEGNGINFRIDVGSAGVPFIRKLLRLLAKYPTVQKVIVDL